MQSYCVSCRKNTENKNVKIVRRKMVFGVLGLWKYKK